MIAVKLHGRLGNQLFQYAFIYAASKKLNTSFYIDKTYQQFVLPQFFNINKDLLYPFDRVFAIPSYKDVLKYYFNLRFYKSLKRLFGLKSVYFNNESEPQTELQKLSDKALYHGYFQSVKYFADYELKIKELFEIKSIYKQAFDKIFISLPTGFTYVTIHIRRGDYIDHDLALPLQYYHDAIKSIHNPNNFYIIISDDPEIMKKEFSYLENKYVSENPEIIDFQFLIASDICIISNSSFSWWGAFLNKKSARIIAPQYWLGTRSKQEFPRDVIQSSWDIFNDV